MDFYIVMLIIAILTTGLVAGFAFTFTTLVMPGLGCLDDKEYLRSFQAIDRLLQRDPPKVGTQKYFGLVFFSAILSLLLCLVFGFTRLDLVNLILMILAAIVYGLGTILTTAVVNLPLNHQIQTYRVDSMSKAELSAARKKFETRWNNANLVRTLASITAFTLLIVVLLRLSN